MFNIVILYCFLKIFCAEGHTMYVQGTGQITYIVCFRIYANLMRNKVKTRKYLGRKLILSNFLLVWDNFAENSRSVRYTNSQIFAFKYCNYFSWVWWYKMVQWKQTLCTISEINSFLDDLNADFSSSSSSFDDSESECKCYIDFSCNTFSKNSK